MGRLNRTSRNVMSTSGRASAKHETYLDSVCFLLTAADMQLLLLLEEVKIMENAPCLGCKHTYFEGGGFGLEVCLACGLARTSVQTHYSNEFSTHERLHGQQSYTRLKRFKKYLCRAMRQQSSATVPKETWDYLVERGPYHGPRHVHQVLKKARCLKRKCYDSLPFLTAALCPQLELPQLSQHEKFRAITLFQEN